MFLSLRQVEELKLLGEVLVPQLGAQLCQLLVENRKEEGTAVHRSSAEVEAHGWAPQQLTALRVQEPAKRLVRRRLLPEHQRLAGGVGVASKQPLAEELVQLDFFDVLRLLLVSPFPFPLVLARPPMVGTAAGKHTRGQLCCGRNPGDTGAEMVGTQW